MRLKKWLIGIAIIFGVLFLLFKLVVWPMMQVETKKISPQKTSTYTQNGLDISISYSSPLKKGRVIFGELVPYDVVWRTGANEPTTFTTKTAIKIIDKELAAGTYSLWSIPRKENWTIIFNSEVPDWGVTLLSGGKETTRNPDLDVVKVEIPTHSLSSVQESFTISLQDTKPIGVSLSWDQTEIVVPINY